MIVHFVDIDGIDDHHCLNLLFIHFDEMMMSAAYQTNTLSWVFIVPIFH
jgi:hypothetical protein